MHVDDLGEACVLSLERWQPKPEEVQFINVGTGLNITIREVAETVANIMEFKGKIIWDKTKPDGAPRKQLDVSRINELGWKARIPLNEGLKTTIKEFKQNTFQKH